MPSTKASWEDFKISYRNKLKNPVTIELLENKIVITAHIKFSKNLLEPYALVNTGFRKKGEEPKPEGYTYADAAIEGIKDSWGKEYILPGREEPVKVEVNLVRFDDPDAKFNPKQRFFTMRYSKVSDTSFVSSQPWRWVWGLFGYLSLESTMLNWSRTFPGIINMKKYKFLPTFKKTCAHEFGHILGIGDAYGARYRFYYEVPDSTGYMMNNNVEVQPEELMMVLRAHQTGRMQYFPIVFNFKTYFDGLKREIKYYQKQISKSHKSKH